MTTMTLHLLPYHPQMMRSECMDPRRPASFMCACMTVGLLLLCSLQSMIAEEGKSDAAGFYRTRQDKDGTWWFIDPEGKRFISVGLNVITMEGDRVKGTGSSPYANATKRIYGNRDIWRKATVERLDDFGFNTIGAWSDPGLALTTVQGRLLAVTPIYHVAEAAMVAMGNSKHNLRSAFPDVFDPRFESAVRDCTQRTCAPMKDMPNILGWFSDNELRWGPDWKGPEEMITFFLNLEPGSPGRREVTEFFQKRYDSVEKFNAVWRSDCTSWHDIANGDPLKMPYVRKAVYHQGEGEEREANIKDPQRAIFVTDCDAFLEIVADRYFSITHQALNAAAPNHLDLGCRFAYVPPAPVIRAAAKYVDVISANCYVINPTKNLEILTSYGKPAMIGEFLFRAKDAGLKNSKGAGHIVPSQTERASFYEDYVTKALKVPGCIGYHWFQHIDMPKEGRYDGEDGNTGVIRTDDRPYEELTQAMTRIGKSSVELHSTSTMTK